MTTPGLRVERKKENPMGFFRHGSQYDIYKKTTFRKLVLIFLKVTIGYNSKWLPF